MNNRVKIGISVCVILLLGVISYAIYSARNYEASFIKEVNPDLTEEERRIYEERLASAESSIDQTNDQAEKFSYMMQKGFNLYGLGKYSDAVNAFEEAHQLKPSDANVFVALAQVKIQMNDPRGALKDIKRANELKPTDPDVWKKYIQIELERFQADPTRINSLFGTALHQTNSHVDIVTAYASWLENSGNFQAAKEYWQKAIQINSSGRSLYEAEIAKLDRMLDEQQ